jgi:hypothetical protein
MTFTELMKMSAQALGHLRAGMSPNASQLADGLAAMNAMIAASNTSSANIFTRRLDQYVMVANKQAYTIGDPAGILTDLAGVRPIRIEHDGVNLFLTTSPVIRRPIKVLTQAQWADIRLQEVYTYPAYVYYDEANYEPAATPVRAPTLRFHPIPADAYPWEMYSWQQNAQLASVTSEIVFPPGYDEYWIYNLALRIAPMLGAPITTLVAEMARKSEAAVQSLNARSPMLSTDPALAGKHGTFFNWLSREIR